MCTFSERFFFSRQSGGKVGGIDGSAVDRTVGADESCLEQYFFHR